MDESHKFNQRFHQIRGLRHELQNSNQKNLPTILAQLNYSLIQYDNMLDGELSRSSNIKQISKRQDKSLDQSVQKTTKLNQSIIDPYVVIDQTRQKRFKIKQGVNAQEEYLPQVLNQMTTQRPASQPEKSKKQNIQKIRKGLINKPKHVISKLQRNDPFAIPAILHQDQLHNLGILNLVNKGIIPKDIDIGPAFERGQPLLSIKLANLMVINKSRPSHDIIPSFMTKNVIRDNMQLNIIKQKSRQLKQSKTFKTQTKLSSQILFTLNESEKCKYQFKKIENFVNNYSQVSVQEISQKQLAQMFQINQLTFTQFQLNRYDQNYLRFKSLNMTSWGSIEHIFRIMESFFKEHNILSVRVDGGMILEYAKQSLIVTVKKYNLLVLLVVEQEVRKTLLQKIKLDKFYCVVKIQSLVRLFCVRNRLCREQLLSSMAIRIQRCYKRWSFRRNSLALLQVAQITRHEFWLQQQTVFKNKNLKTKDFTQKLQGVKYSQLQ